MRVKKLCMVLLMAVMLIVSAVPAAADAEYSTVRVGLMLDEPIVQEWDESVYGRIEVVNERTMIPLRIVSERMGYDVQWNQSKMEAIVTTTSGVSIRFPYGKNEIITPNGTIRMDVPNMAFGNRIYLPIRFFFEAFGHEVYGFTHDQLIGYGIDTSSISPNYSYFVFVKYVYDDRADQTQQSQTQQNQQQQSQWTQNQNQWSQQDQTQQSQTQETTDVGQYGSDAASRSALSEETVQVRIKLLEGTYPTGTPLDDNNYSYIWKHSTAYIIGTGCAGYAFMVSDIGFGTEGYPPRLVSDVSDIEKNIRVGDLVRINNDTHFIVITDRDESGVTVTQGNLRINGAPGAVHWGEKMSYAELKSVADYYYTRYPER